MKETDITSSNVSVSNQTSIKDDVVRMQKINLEAGIDLTNGYKYSVGMLKVRRYKTKQILDLISDFEKTFPHLIFTLSIISACSIIVKFL